MAIRLLSTTLLIISCTFFSCANGAEESQISAQVRAVALSILSDPLFVELDPERSAWRVSESGTIMLPSEEPDHPQGVFRMKSMVFKVLKSTPAELSASCYGEPEVRVFKEDHTVLSKDEGKQHALKFLNAHFPWFFKLGQAPVLQVTDYRPGIWSYEWNQIGPDEFRIATANAHVRAVDGKVVGFGAYRRTNPWPEHRLSPSQAKTVALQLVSREKLLADAQVTRWDLLYVNPKATAGQSLSVYQISLRAIDIQSRQTVANTVEIDAMTGDFRSWLSEWEPDESHQDSHLRSARVFSNDRFPVWTKRGLVFMSDRQVIGIPSWTILSQQLFTVGQTGRVAYLTSDLSLRPGFITGTAGSPWIAVERGLWSYALNTETGKSVILAYPTREASMPAIDGLGQIALTCSTGRDSNATTLDMFAASLQQPSKWSGTRQRLVAVGEQHHPVFTPDGKWLYFVTTKRLNGKTINSLNRVNRDVLKMGKPLALREQGLLPPNPHKLDEKETQTLISQLPGDIERISIFPGGKRLLLQTKKDILIATEDGSKVIPITLPSLQDTDLPGARIQEVKDGYAGPTDDRITFSGKTVDINGKVRWRIYSCHFDGSLLMAHTPLEDKPTSSYKFPDKNSEAKNSYDIARAWALQEIKFEDELKQRN